MAGKTRAYTRRLLHRARRRRELEERAAARAQKAFNRRDSRVVRKVDAALRGCQDA